jgi:acetyl-CoA carboxylase biotin carboxylase subunit
VIEKVLVANRGEIARRVFRTCREMGLATVAVYSDADANAAFVAEADEAVPLGGTTPADSYLRADLVLAAASATDADAIHPGYGFLSENADFARACTDAGITFIGPSAKAIELMGSKLAARQLMEAAGVPVLPGVEVTGLAPGALLDAASTVGWPVLVKASAGGGGRGMRVVRDPGALADSVESAQREALAAFGDDTVFLERYVENPRHIEVQIFGDATGDVVHLNERECSIQRRHQKIIEEAPSPAVSPQLRAEMGDAAVAAGRAIGYQGAGTVEFIVAPGGEFFFLEVNTRLQVEHPVTELVTGLDLVRIQIAVADGEPLPDDARYPAINGHAVEARLYAEDPLADFLPAVGLLDRFHVPAAPGVRVDAGVTSGDTVSVHYDPMLAKVIAHGSTRAEATRRLSRALRGAQIHGVTTNRDLLVAILEDEEYRAGRIDTHFLQRRSPASLLRGPAADSEENLACVAALLSQQAANRASSSVLRTLPAAWRNNPSAARVQEYLTPAGSKKAGIVPGAGTVCEVDGAELDVRVLHAAPDHVELLAGSVRRAFRITRGAAGNVYVDSQRGSVTLRPVPRFPDAAVHTAAGGLTAPMPGTVVALNVAPGDAVSAGAVLVVLEAMKMEHQVLAPASGVVASVAAGVGTTVDAGDLLVVVSAPPPPNGDVRSPAPS